MRDCRGRDVSLHSRGFRIWIIEHVAGPYVGPWAVCAFNLYAVFTSADTAYQPNGRTFTLLSVLLQWHTGSTPPTLPLPILFLFLALILPIRGLVFQWRYSKCFVGFENDFSSEYQCSVSCRQSPPFCPFYCDYSSPNRPMPLFTMTSFQLSSRYLPTISCSVSRLLNTSS